MVIGLVVFVVGIEWSFGLFGGCVVKGGFVKHGDLRSSDDGGDLKLSSVE